jgi:hypothetical protein
LHSALSLRLWIGQVPFCNWGFFRRRFNPITEAKLAVETIGLLYLPITKKVDGWYVADKSGPFKTRELARIARAIRLSNQ